MTPMSDIEFQRVPQKCPVCLVTGIMPEDVEGHREWHRTMTNLPAHVHSILGPPKEMGELNLVEIALIPEDQVLPEWRGITEVVNITPVIDKPTLDQYASQRPQHKPTCAVFTTITSPAGKPGTVISDCDCGAVT
jgi:hypothetical protein